MSVAQYLAQNNGSTAHLLRLAVMNCDVETTKLLIDERIAGGSVTGTLRGMDRAAMIILMIRDFGGPNPRFSYDCVRIIRLIIDAGVDISLRVRMATPNHRVFCEESCLDAVMKLKRLHTGGDLRKMDFLHSMLLREKAVHALSWLWPTSVVAHAVPGTPTVPATNAKKARATLKWKRGSGRVVLRGLFRLSGKSLAD